MSHAVVVAALILSGCGYKVEFADCEVTCEGSGECPDGFSCMAGLCRVEGAGTECLAPGEVTLRQTDNDMVERNLVFGCTNPDTTTADGSWYRVFSLAQEGISTTFDVTKVTLGICFAVGEPEVTVRVGSYGGGAAGATLDLAQIANPQTATVPVMATQISKTIDIPITTSIPAGSNLIVEVAVPDLEGTGEQVNVGFTASSERKPGYVRSPLCGPAAATNTSGAGLPNARLVLTVTGTP
jgi:hypothetical protein